MVAIGAIHSLLGEKLIFSRMRTTGWVPKLGGAVLHERHVRILWATWHLVTVLGLFVAIAILEIRHATSLDQSRHLMTMAVIGATSTSSAFVLIGTRGRHPGWIGLLGVALLVGAGAYA
ncbi:MAG: hypothetical protein CVU22_20875 [Betaproteobacteria bacterium HGW-Betaproteobacteria-16]|nr:MAG: hypothetical protein CVU22_20875 [Betaproteobacteria bacterium HGW-Betaproteobacteria-16]